MRLASLSAVALAALVPAAALAQGTVTVETAAGPAEAPRAPETVAVFDAAAADTIDALGVDIDGLPAPLAVPSLEDAAEAATPVGTLFEPDFEALAALAPDVIIAGGRSAAQVEALSRVAPTLDMTIPADDFPGAVRARLDAYGALFGREAEADALEAELDAAIRDARAAVEGKGDALILLVNGGKLSAFGAGSRFGWLHEALGLPEAAPGIEAGTHGEAVSFEFVAEADPDWILTIDRGAAIGEAGRSAAAVLDNPLVAGTKAGEAGRIVHLDPAPLYVAGGGVRSVLGTLGEVEAAFEEAEDARG